VGGGFGRYEITEEIGRGAMGVVHRAHDPLIGRDVAIKVVNQSYLESVGVKAEEYFQRFRREAEVAGRLNHPAIVKIYDLGPNYIVMEFVEGRSLSASIATLAGRPLSSALDIVGQVAAALDHAHGQGVVHRDIKPANIMLRLDGTVKVMDFGLARVESSTLTAAGEILGSASYMAPETVLGQPATARSDVFSLGVVAYELMTGRRPFAGASVSAIIHSIVRAQPPAPHKLELNLPPDYDAIFEKVLCKEAPGRYASAGEFAQALVLKRWADRDPLVAVSIPDVAAEDAPTRVNIGPGAAREPAAPVPPEDATLVLAEDMPFGDSDDAAPTRPPTPAPSPQAPSSSGPGGVSSRTPAANRRLVLGLAGAVLIAVAAFLASTLTERSPSVGDAPGDAAPSPASPPPTAASTDAAAALSASEPAPTPEEPAAGQPSPSGAPAKAALAPAALSVLSEPAGANVVVGGKLLGATPLRASVPPGRVTVLVLKAGYEPWSQDLALEAGGTHTLSARLASRASAVPEPAPSASATPPTVQTGDLVVLSDEVAPPRRISGSGPSVSASQVGRAPGSVVVEFVVDESGLVVSPRIVESAGAALDKACLEAVGRWRYEPAVTQGVRVKVVQRATFRFERR